MLAFVLLLAQLGCADSQARKNCDGLLEVGGTGADCELEACLACEEACDDPCVLALNDMAIASASFICEGVDAFGVHDVCPSGDGQ